MASHNHGILDSLQKFGHLLQSAARPLPTQTGDGTYIEKESHSNILEDLASLNISDVNTLIELLEKGISGNKLIDDRTMFTEHLITLASKLPPESPNRAKLSNAFTLEIWNSLDHPPACGLGDLYNYRQADGSYNNIHLPDLGKAGTPYARSVQPKMIRPASQPDPGLIFDTIMSRENGGFKPHPNSISSMLFYLATLIIHDCFHTSREDPSISQTSSYLDLSPLYGVNQEEQNQMRTFKNGFIKPDSFSDKRILGFPPGVSCLLIMFNRFHNYVATNLALINENGRFSAPADSLQDDKKKAAHSKRDNDLFQTARLVTCGLYFNIVLRDYVRTILNLNRTDSNWWIDPRADVGDRGKSMATGNQCSFEFNLIYVWHSAISQRDERWTQNLYEKLLGKDYDKATEIELLATLSRWESVIPKDPQMRTFENLQRQANGTFNDDDLVKILTESIEDLAGAFGANNVPPILRAVEVLVMNRSRKWHAASLNEFRTFFGLKPHATFEEVNSDPVVANHLKSLYEHPDYVELYPGVVVEESKPVMKPGSGLCPGYTISRTILSDAITLVRGDRHYTLNYHAGNLTNWGMKEVEADPSFEEGIVFYKLFLRAFPRHFAYNSVYAHYPMTIPSENAKILTALGRVGDYSFARPARQPPIVVVKTFQGVDHALANRALRVEPWRPGFVVLGGADGAKACLAGDGDFFAGQRANLGHCMYPQKWEGGVRRFYAKTIQELLARWSSPVGPSSGISSKSQGVKTRQVDIVRDIGTLANTAKRPHGVFSEHELRDVLTLMFTVVFSAAADPARQMALYAAAKPISEAMGRIMEAEVRAAGESKLLGDLVAQVNGQDEVDMKEYGVRVLRKLFERCGGNAREAVYAHVLTAAAPMVTLNSSIFAQALDYYLGEGAEHWPKIQEIARQDTPESDELLIRYALEGVRLNGSNSVLRHAHADTTIQEGLGGVGVRQPPPTRLAAGATVLVSFDALARDPSRYPDPNTVRLDRDLENGYRFYGHGAHTCLGEPMSRVSQAVLLRAAGRLRNLRRAPGAQGQLKMVVPPGNEGLGKMYMDELQSMYSPFPTTMKVLYDE
ncbi:prostaglandin-endoperoxide synthase 1 [Apiospora marii]|uniref:Prostaglandin-endoperoxide synthase 1 n=1 Tax=Apiospora marii TaxID=335849 RepID=A0ABR1SRN1_9PEZI